jgi:valyl-tRNA synthetase
MPAGITINPVEQKMRFRSECKAKPGRHSFVKIYERGGDMESEVVRWCPICGSVVVDVDFDGRTNAGQVMKMRSPEITRYSYVAFGEEPPQTKGE